MIEDRARQTVVLPSYFGVPLHAEYELAASRILDGFDDAVRGPRNRNQISADVFNCLMMMAVDGRARPAGKPRKQGIFSDADRVLMPLLNIALAMPDRIFCLGSDVLNQGSSAIYVEDLDAKADAEHGKTPLFGRLQEHQIRLVASRNVDPAIQDGLTAIPEWINIAVRPGQA